MIEFLISIAQKIFIFFISILAFLGISPDFQVPTEQETKQVQQSRDETIKNFFSSLEENKTQIPESLKKVFEIPENYDENKSIATEPTPPTKTESSIPKIIDSAVNVIQSGLSFQKGDFVDQVVNIVCLRRIGKSIESHSGSGVIIDPRGVIVTNAHVAQFFLLETEANKNYMDCAVFRENIPMFGYEAKLLYISPDWVKNNYKNINERNPIGTGENDYAFLFITGNINPSLSIPKTFDYSQFLTDYKYKKGNKIAVASYPGAPAKIVDISKNIKLQTDNTRIADVYTLDGETVDVIATEETKLAQKGSSGGGVFDANKNILGLIVTISEAGSGFAINAITTEYINRNLFNKEGFDVSSLLQGDSLTNSLMQKVNEFYDSEVPALRNLVQRVY